MIRSLIEPRASRIANISDAGDGPVLSPEALGALAHRVLELATADMAVVRIDHVAIGTARVAQGVIQLNESGDTLRLELTTAFGHRGIVDLHINEIDDASVRYAVRYAEQLAREQPGDPVQTAMPLPPRTYPPVNLWHDATISAFDNGRHAMVEQLVAPMNAASIRASGFVGVAVHSQLYADRQGFFVAGREADSEITVTGWAAQGNGSGWAGQAARDWSTLRPERVVDDAIRLTRLSANPVAFEPGRYTAILDRPAVAQATAWMGGMFDAERTFRGDSVLYDPQARRVRLGQRIVDPRVELSSDPNDPEGGYLPFNDHGYPLVAMTWIGRGGVLENLAYNVRFAAERGVTPANDAPASLRMSGGETTVDSMIARCKLGIYVNRFAQIGYVDVGNGIVTGVTNGGCFLVRNGKIDKAIRNFRFVESPWLFLNRVDAIGPSQRAPFGYAPWLGHWPIAPMIVPPLMIRDFNFVALADAV